MLADFFRKNNKKILGIGLACWFGFIAIFCGVLAQGRSIYLQKSFYFLVDSSTHIQASTHLVELSGGAGYLLDYDGCEKVAFSVYLQEKDGLKAQESFSGKEARLMPITMDCIYVYRWRDKQNIKSIQSAFQTLYNYCEVLEKIIWRFSQGATQESGKRLLKTLESQLCFSSEEYIKIFPQYANFCKKGAEHISQLLQGIIYVKELRYLLCEFCMVYVRLAEDF